MTEPMELPPWLRRFGPGAALALVAYVPLLLTRRGMVVADTKQYLYLDPGGVMSASASLWDPDWALGTVTHQSIGYLWPMGPWFWTLDQLGFPDWVAQRLWIGTVLLAAGLGVRFLGRVFAWSSAAALAAAFVYMLSPYPIAYMTRISALVLPWAALPWLVGLGVRSLRRDGWRDPILIGLVGTTVGSVNASSLLYAGVAVIAWFPFAVFVFGETDIRRAIVTALRIGVALVAACLWWIVALVVQGGYGADVLQFSETLEVVASGSPASEAWRGLGYWVFYGGDRTGPWVSAGVDYTQEVWLIAATFALAGVGFAALFVARWRYRAYFLALAALGVILTVGFYPYDRPGGVLLLMRDDIADTGLALALRSSPRALPMTLLALSASIAVVLDTPRWRPVRPRAGLALVALAAVCVPALWTGRYIGDELARDEHVPPSWQAAADHLDDGDPDHRVLIVPGSDFSAHRWGNTIDHILPGLVDRPVAVRELVAFSPPAAADLLIALDRRLQERVLDPAALAPVARLLGAGDVIVQHDLEYERYRTPRPDELWSELRDAPGFDPPVEFGPPTPNLASDEFPLVDELELTLPPDLPDPPPVAALPVTEPVGVLRLRTGAAPMIVGGDGETLVDLAAAGLLADDRAVLYEAAIDDGLLADAVAAGAEVVLSDGNRLAARRWKTIRDNRGMTEQIGGDGLDDDPSDARLEVFPEAGPDSFTTARHDGVRALATTYGNPISYHPEDRAVHAVDGDVTTAWRAGSFTDARGAALTLVPDEPVDGGVITLVQPTTLEPNRHITELDVSVNDGPFRRVTLGVESIGLPGQTLDLDVERIESVVLRVWETSAGRRPGYGGLSPVGFAEVGLGVDQPLASETIVLAPALGERIAALGADVPITVVMRRERAFPIRDDPETALRREFTLPSAARFDLSSVVRVAKDAPDHVLDDVLGLAAAPRAVSSERIRGSASVRASAVLDGDPATMWMPPIGDQEGQWIELDLGAPRAIDGFDLTVVADGRHSVPTVIDVTTDLGSERIALPPIEDRSAENAVTTVPVAIAPTSTSTLRVTVVEVRAVEKVDWFSATDVVQPVGLAEISVPGVEINAPDVDALLTCRDDLLTVDGRPVGLRLGSPTAEQSGLRLEAELCDEPLELGAGVHRIETAVGRHHGLDVDRLVLRSIDRPDPVAPPPAFEVVDRGRDRADLRIDASEQAYWVVLGESFNDGWTAEVDGRSLGAPTLVDGFANGWLVEPDGGQVTVRLRWTPNRWVRIGFLVSVVGTLALVAVAVVGHRRRRDGVAGEGADDEEHQEHGVAATDPGSSVTGRSRVVTALVAGAATAAVTRIAVGLAVALVVYAAATEGERRRLPAFLGGLAFAAMGAFVVVQQIRHSPPHDGAWPSLWGRAHLLGWIALGAIIAELVREIVARRAARR